MEETLDKLEATYLPFKLGVEQRNALLQVFSFIDNYGFNQLVLCGKAGTGKTSLITLIIQYLIMQNIPYILVTPTHKSRKVLASKTYEDVVTIHQLLELKPNINILNLDLNDLKFCSSTLDDGVPKDGVIIIDECSMINDDLYETLIKSCKKKNCKIIATGDTRQLAPVKQTNLSKLFTIDNVIELTIVHRQNENNPLLSILNELRKHPIYEFNEFESDNGSLKIYKRWQDLLDNNINLFRTSIDSNNPEMIRILAYTNKRVEAFNSVVRNKIFTNPEEYMIGDFITGYDNHKFVDNRNIFAINNSDDYQIVKADKKSKLINGINVEGWNLKVFDFFEKQYKTFYVLSRNNTESTWTDLGKMIEDLRMKAIKCKNKQEKSARWVIYFKVTESFLSPIDITVNNRVIFKKSLDYGYAMTTHKSQSSSYDKVLIDMGNIFHCFNKSELRQLQYVAMSRTRKDIELLI